MATLHTPAVTPHSLQISHSPRYVPSHMSLRYCKILVALSNSPPIPYIRKIFYCAFPSALSNSFSRTIKGQCTAFPSPRYFSQTHFPHCQHLLIHASFASSKRTLLLTYHPFCPTCNPLDQHSHTPFLRRSKG